MEEFQNPLDQKGFDYIQPEPVGSGAGGAGGSSLSGPFSDSSCQQSGNNQPLTNFNQFTNYTISPQQPVEPIGIGQPQQQLQAGGFSYDPIGPVFNNQQQVLYPAHQTPIDWNRPSPHWLVNAHASSSSSTGPPLVHAGTSSAVDSSRWSPAYHQPTTNLVPPTFHRVPPMGVQLWEPDQSTNSLSSSARLKPFIEKLYNILAQPGSFRDCLVWDEGGTAFIVSHANPRLLQQVLPDAFGHSNLHSFTRQLNIYGFTRCTSAELLSKLDVT